MKHVFIKYIPIDSYFKQAQVKNKITQMDKQLMEIQDRVRQSKPEKRSQKTEKSIIPTPKPKNLEEVEKKSKEALKNLEEMQL